MQLMTTAGQFIIGCLAFGLGLFLLAGTLRDLPRLQLSPASSGRATFGLGAMALLAIGALVAAMAVPL
jgi:hypothetical protein